MTTILVVDDNDLVRDALALLLARSGHDVLEAADGEEALLLIKTSVPDLVVTDILMPEMAGFEMIEEVRKVAPDVKIIAMTGGTPIGPEDLLQHAARLGANETFAKPIDREKFLESVNRLLQSA
jgi:CheY-like chemotaxis protein